MDIMTKFLNHKLSWTSTFLDDKYLNSETAKIIHNIKNKELTSDELSILFDKNNDILTSYLILTQHTISDKIIDKLIQNEEISIDVMKFLLIQKLSPSQINALIDRFSIDCVAQFWSEQGEAGKFFFYIHPDNTDYMTNILMSIPNGKLEIYKPISYLQNDKIVEEYLNNIKDISEIQLSEFVNAKRISPRLRIQAYEMGCDIDKIDIDISSGIPKEIIRDIYAIVSQNHFEYRDTSDLNASLILSCLLYENVLPEDCQLDFLMHYTEEKTRKSDIMLERLLKTTKSETVLTEARKLKNSNKITAYMNPYMPPLFCSVRFGELYEKIKQQTGRRSDYTENTIKQLVKLAENVKMYSIQRSFFSSLNYLPLQLLVVHDCLKDLNCDKYQHYLQPVENNAYGWLRNYSAFGKIQLSNNLDENIKNDVYKLLQYFHFDYNSDITYPEHISTELLYCTIESEEYYALRDDLFAKKDKLKEVIKILDEISTLSNHHFGKVGKDFINTGKNILLLQECEKQNIPISERTTDVLEQRLSDLVNSITFGSSDIILYQLNICNEFTNIENEVKEIIFELEGREKDIAENYR